MPLIADSLPAVSRRRIVFRRECLSSRTDAIEERAGNQNYGSALQLCQLPEDGFCVLQVRTGSFTVGKWWNVNTECFHALLCLSQDFQRACRLIFIFLPRGESTHHRICPRIGFRSDNCDHRHFCSSKLVNVAESHVQAKSPMP